MQEGRKCIFAILWENQFCALIFFVFHCFLTSCFVHKIVNILSWDLYYDSKCAILHVLSIYATSLISPKISLTTFLHSHDEMVTLLKSERCKNHSYRVKITFKMSENHSKANENHSKKSENYSKRANLTFGGGGVGEEAHWGTALLFWAFRLWALQKSEMYSFGVIFIPIGVIFTPAWNDFHSFWERFPLGRVR